MRAKEAMTMGAGGGFYFFWRGDGEEAVPGGARARRVRLGAGRSFVSKKEDGSLVLESR